MFVLTNANEEILVLDLNAIIILKYVFWKCEEADLLIYVLWFILVNKRFFFKGLLV